MIHFGIVVINGRASETKQIVNPTVFSLIFNSYTIQVESGSLKLKAQLDFETATSHALTIQVSDGVAGHNKDITGTVTVGSVDEGPPVFTQSMFLASCV